MNPQPAHALSLIAFLSLLLSTQSDATEPADSVNTSSWLCNFCTYRQGWFGTLEFGPGYAGDGSLKFADYRGITDKGAFMSIYGDIHYLDDDGKYFDLYARDLGTSARQLEMRGGRQGSIEFRLAYREIPKYRGYGTQTVHRGAGGDRLVLPQNWVNAPTTTGMSALDASLTTTKLETRRKIFDAGLSFKLSGKWRYNVDFQHTAKNGTRAFGAGVFTIQASHFPAPVDFSINRIDMGIEYSGHRSRLRLGFSTSSFNNRYASVTWENPFTPPGNTGVLRAALEPDSKFHQFSLTGSFSPMAGLRVSGQASIGRIKQNVQFIPYSSNPDFGDLPLPRTSLDGKLDTSTINLGARLSARLSRKLRLRVQMKFYDRDNRTPVDFYTPVITDLVQRQETPNRPYSFRRSQYTAELVYRVHRSVRVTAGAKWKDYKRTLQSVRETTEHIWWGEVSFHQWSMAQLKVKFESSNRDMSPYRQVSDPGLPENILMRKFHLADRERERALIELDLSPGERLSASLSYIVSRDRYQRSILGLMKSDEHSLSLDLGYAVKANLSLHAFITLDEYDSDISGASAPKAAAWLATTNDRFTTYGFGLNGKLSDKLDLRIDYISSTARGRIRTDSGAGEAAFPELETGLRNFNISLAYQASQQWGLTLRAEHEYYDSTDWQIDGLGNDGISAVLTLGPQSPHYSVTLFRLMARYRF